MTDPKDSKPLQLNESKGSELPGPLVGKIIPKQQRYKGGRNTELDSLWLDYARLYLENWQEEGKQIPTIPGLCLATGISEATFYNWIAKLSDPNYDCNEVESQFLDVACNLQLLAHDGLLQGGLSGKLQPTITKLVLVKFGYSDKIEAEISQKHPGGSAIAELSATEAATAYLELLTGHG